jgi:hypothetical protein
MVYQQGDVLLKAVDRIPPKAKPVDRRNGRFILADGEVTGHAHAVVDDVELVELEGTLYIRSKAPFAINHEEHHQITVPQGLWEVTRVREYDHFAEWEARSRGHDQLNVIHMVYD